jgi:formate/nitrite transporter
MGGPGAERLLTLPPHDSGAEAAGAGTSGGGELDRDEGPARRGGRALLALREAGFDKGSKDAWSLLLSSVMAGFYIAIGAAVFVRAQALGSGPLVGALLFPAGLSFVVLTGCDLLTSNMMFGLLPLLSGDRRRTGSGHLSAHARLLALSLVGNAAGCALVAAALAASLDPDLAVLGPLASKKTSLSALAVLAKAVAANWLVNLAVFQSAQAEEPAHKVALIWLPIASFVLLGLEHSVANFFLLPAALLAGAPVSWPDVVLGNLLPCLAGNQLGAALFAAGQWHVAQAAAKGNLARHLLRV